MVEEILGCRKGSDPSINEVQRDVGKAWGSGVEEPLASIVELLFCKCLSRKYGFVSDNV